MTTTRLDRYAAIFRGCTAAEDRIARRHALGKGLFYMGAASVAGVVGASTGGGGLLLLTFGLNAGISAFEDAVLGRIDESYRDDLRATVGETARALRAAGWEGSRAELAKRFLKECELSADHEELIRAQIDQVIGPGDAPLPPGTASSTDMAAAKARVKKKAEAQRTALTKRNKPAPSPPGGTGGRPADAAGTSGGDLLKMASVLATVGEYGRAAAELATALGVPPKFGQMVSGVSGVAVGAAMALAGNPLGALAGATALASMFRKPRPNPEIQMLSAQITELRREVLSAIHEATRTLSSQMDKIHANIVLSFALFDEAMKREEFHLLYTMETRLHQAVRSLLSSGRDGGAGSIGAPGEFDAGSGHATEAALAMIARTFRASYAPGVVPFQNVVDVAEHEEMREKLCLRLADTDLSGNELKQIHQDLRTLWLRWVKGNDVIDKLKSVNALGVDAPNNDDEPSWLARIAAWGLPLSVDDKSPMPLEPRATILFCKLAGSLTTLEDVAPGGVAPSRIETLRSAAIAFARTAALQWGLLEGLGIADRVANALFGKAESSKEDLSAILEIMRRRPILRQNVLVALTRQALAAKGVNALAYEVALAMPPAMSPIADLFQEGSVRMEFFEGKWVARFSDGLRVPLPRHADLTLAPHASPATRALLALDDDIVGELTLEEMRTSSDTREHVAALVVDDVALRRRLTIWDLAEGDPTRYREQVGWDRTWG